MRAHIQAAGVIGVLALAAPPERVANALGQLAAPGVTDPGSCVAAVVAALAWLIACWLGACLGLALLARLPGITGRLCTRAVRAVTPPVLRGVVGVVCCAAAAAPATARAESPRPTPPAVSLDRPADPPRAPTRVLVVRPGDCLWSIAAAHVRPHSTPAEVARAWPRWYAANRAVIGPDPGRIYPGQRLTEPTTEDPSPTP